MPPPLTLEERLRRINAATADANRSIQAYHGARGRINEEILALTEHFAKVEAEVVELRAAAAKPQQCSTCGWKLKAKPAKGAAARFDPDLLPAKPDTPGPIDDPRGVIDPRFAVRVRAAERKTR